MKKLVLFVVMLAMVLAATVPALAATWSLGSCGTDFVTQEEAQKVLEDPNYGHYDQAFVPPPNVNPDDIYNLDPDGDGVACNNEGNLIRDDINLVPPYLVDCTRLYDPATSCTVDENGLITLPDGSKAPYTVAGAPISGPDGLYEYVEGEFVLVEAYPPSPPPPSYPWGLHEIPPPEYCAEFPDSSYCG